MTGAPSLERSNFRYILRNTNKVVDWIAKVDGGILDQLTILEDPSQNERCWLEDDIKQSLT